MFHPTFTLKSRFFTSRDFMIVSKDFNQAAETKKKWKYLCIYVFIFHFTVDP